MVSVLFVCTANRYRSPIAAACFEDELLNHDRGNGWSVLSAGTWASDGMSAMPDAVREAQKLGLDIRGHRSQAITAELLQQASLVLVMERGQKEALQVEFPFARRKVLLLTEVVEGTAAEIPDPVLDPSKTEVASEICSLIRTGFDRICALAAEQDGR